MYYCDHSDFIVVHETAACPYCELIRERDRKDGKIHDPERERVSKDDKIYDLKTEIKEFNEIMLAIGRGEPGFYDRKR